MKSSEIYTGATLAFTNGEVGIAVYPAQKGVSHSMALTKSGKLIKIPGARISGLGVPRYLQSQGFSLAGPDDQDAAVLADRLDAEDGVRLLEDASRRQAENYRSWLEGKSMKLVPYDVEKPVQQVTFSSQGSGFRTAFHLDTGLSLAGMAIEYLPSKGDTLDLQDGWVIGLEEDESASPRNTEYGGSVELACYLLCNAGLAVLDGHQNLADGIEEVKDVPFPRGFLRLRVTDVRPEACDDVLVVGITATDELEVVYERAGQAIYRRHGLLGTKLSKVLGSIAAALVRVREMDAAASKVKTKKRA